MCVGYIEDFAFSIRLAALSAHLCVSCWHFILSNCFIRILHFYFIWL